MITRRKFLQHTGATVSAWALSSAAWSLPVQSRPIGLQLFTLMGPIDQDLNGSLKKVADLGFRELESAFSMKGGYYGLKPKEFMALAGDFGLAWRSHHVMGTPFVPPPGVTLPEAFAKMRTLKNNTQELVDEAAEGGVKYLVCASIDIKTGDAVKTSTDILNQAGGACRKAGITLAYHNHDAEFRPVDGLVPYDHFLSQLDKNIKMELDLAWISKAGLDPVELFNKNQGRFPLWHVKDFDAEFKTLQPVGKGVIDFKRIFAHAASAGLEHCFVERDMPPNAMESITQSIGYLKEILK